jgi:hypothetical protein
MATEVWRYSAKDGAPLLVGIRGSGRGVGPSIDSDRACRSRRRPPDLPSAGVDASMRGAQNRRFVIAGRFFASTWFAEIGAADRVRAARGLCRPDAAGGARAGPAGTRYTYEAEGRRAVRMRTVFNSLWAGKGPPMSSGPVRVRIERRAVSPAASAPSPRAYFAFRIQACRLPLLDRCVVWR